jgi:glucose/arabinose dehydrogenase
MRKTFTSAKRNPEPCRRPRDRYRGCVRALAPVVALTALVSLVGGSASGAETAFRRAVVVRGLDSLVQVVATRSEPARLYLVEQGGTIRVVERGKLKGGFFLDVRNRVIAGGEQGLLGLAFDPSYNTNRFFYVNFTDRAGDTRVVRFKSRGRRGVLSSARLLLKVDQPYANHNGGDLVFGPDGVLYVGLGDGGSGGDPDQRAQDPGERLGKMLKLDVRKPGSRPEIVGLGLRNPWRYSFDRANGDLYIGDVGQGSIEEIDFTPSESEGLVNYGWDLYEGSQRFEDSEQGPGRLVFPIFEYDHSGGNCTVVGGFVYRGKSRPSVRGRYIFGDYCSGIVWSLKMNGGRAQGVRREPFRIESLTSFGEDVAGELYAVSGEGVLYRLT